MKKIINNKVYDTSTAEGLGSWTNNQCTSDITYVKETLYRKKTGEYFLHGIGGAETCYCSRHSDNWDGGEAIKPLKYESAQKWAKEHLDSDNYEKIFGTINESNEKISFTVSISASTAEKIRRAARQKGVSLSEYVESLFNK